jgi:hypothetical protein
VEADRVAVASQAEAHGEAQEANRVAVKAQATAASDRALVAGGMVDLAASNRELADATKARSLLQLVLLVVLLVAVAGGLYEGSLYVRASNHRATTNGALLQKISDLDAEIVQTNSVIVNYTTGPASIAGRMQLQQELECLTATVHHDVLGAPTPSICVTLGIK